MFNWLATLPQWFQIIITIVFLLTCIYVIFTAIIPFIRNGFSFKKGDNIFFFGEKNFQCSQGTDKCPFKKDLLIFLNESSKLFNEKHTITFISQIKDQMNYAEQKLNQIRLKLHSIYLSELRNKGIKDLVQSNSFIAYKYLLRDIEKDILAKIRYFFRENHFNELSESDFVVYVNNKFEYIISEVTDILNDIYYDDELITREELYDINIKYISEFKPYIIDIFQHARNVALDCNFKLLELDEKIDNLVKRFTIK